MTSMDAAVSTLLNSIAQGRLVALVGAGLSMATPSTVPSAGDLARSISANFKAATGSTSLDPIAGDLEAVARFFHSTGRIADMNVYIDWGPFRSNFNEGHLALADFLSCGVLGLGLTTNCDELVELAARAIGEPDFLPLLDSGNLRPTLAAPVPLLKLHGCCHEREHVLWCREQLLDSPLRERINHAETILPGRLANADFLIIGFATDWDYIAEVLDRVILPSGPARVVLIDPDSLDGLRRKAPRLISWAEGHNLQHVPIGGAAFLGELRRAFSRQFLTRLLEKAKSLYPVSAGGPPPVPPDYLAAASTDDLFALRRDVEGPHHTHPPRQREPTEGMRGVGLAHLRLLAATAVLDGPRFTLAGRTIRVVNAGASMPMSAFKREMQTAADPQDQADVVLCMGVEDDGGAPVDLIRASGVNSIARARLTGTWMPGSQLETLFSAGAE